MFVLNSLNDSGIKSIIDTVIITPDVKYRQFDTILSSDLYIKIIPNSVDILDIRESKKANKFIVFTI